MNKLRVAAAATCLSLVAAFGTMGSASAATNGVGTTETATSLLRVALGDGSPLNLRVLGDDARATVDPRVMSVNEAFSRLFALKLTSSILGNVTVPSPPFESRTPGGAASVTGPAINLGNILPSLPVVGSVLNGTLAPTNLTSSVTEGVAKSGIDASLVDVGLVGDLIGVDAVKNTLGASASPTVANGERSLKVDAISVLDLGALLTGLGIPLGELPVPAVSAILDTLDATGLVSGLSANQTLSGVLATLTDTLDATGVVGDLPVPVQGVLDQLLGGGTAVPDATDVTTLVDDLTATITDLLEGALDVLDDLTLLKVNGLEVGTVTKAVSSTGDSVSGVTAKVGSVQLGNLPLLNGIDIGSALTTVTGLVNTVESTVGGVLNSVAPGLGDILDIKFFDKPSTNGVSSKDGYVRSLAGITGLAVTINPPDNLAAIVTQVLGTTGIAQQITSNGGTLPVVSGLMGSLNGVLGGTSGLASVLSDGAAIRVAELASESEFAVRSAPTATPVAQPPTLPRTGIHQGALLAFGLLFAAFGFGIRRWMPALRATK